MAGTRITITPAGQAVCAALGVATAEALLHLAGGTVVAQSRTTKTVRLETAAGNAYLKRYFVPTLRDWFRGALRWTFLGTSKAQREWENAEAVKRAGWGIPDRLAWADVRSAGALRGCAILTAEVPGADRLDVAWLQEGMGADARRRLLNALAHRLRTAFDQAYVDRNCYARNVLVRREDDGWRLFKVDSPRSTTGRQAFVDLAALDSFARNVCSFRERWRVLRRFAHDRDRTATLEIARAVDVHSLKLQRREAGRVSEATGASAIA